MPYTYADYYNGRDTTPRSQLNQRMPPHIEMLLRNAGLYSDAYQNPASRVGGSGYMPTVLRAAGQYGQAFRAGGGGSTMAPGTGRPFSNLPPSLSDPNFFTGPGNPMGRVPSQYNGPAGQRTLSAQSFAPSSQMEFGDVMQRPKKYRVTRPRVGSYVR